MGRTQAKAQTMSHIKNVDIERLIKVLTDLSKDFSRVDIKTDEVTNQISFLPIVNSSNPKPIPPPDITNKDTKIDKGANLTDLI
jgi:hypothetical protein